MVWTANLRDGAREWIHSIWRCLFVNWDFSVRGPFGESWLLRGPVIRVCVRVRRALGTGLPDCCGSGRCWRGYNAPETGLKERGVQLRASPTVALAYLQPEQDAQQSAEGQHSVLAFATPAKPSAITANSRVAVMRFIFFSFAFYVVDRSRPIEPARGACGVLGFFGVF